MKRTTIIYLSVDPTFELCPSCKNKNSGAQSDTCKSCVVSNFEPIDDPALIVTCQSCNAPNPHDCECCSDNQQKYCQAHRRSLNANHCSSEVEKK